MDAPTNMEPRDAAKVLVRSLGELRAPITIADASAKSGLALRDAERGLHALTSEYRGHLRVTEDGDLLFLFPTGFTKPWETRDAIARIASRLWRGAAGVARFVVRAWLMIAIVAYAGIFVALMIALAFAGNRNHERNDLGAVGAVLLRTLADALFWTFHPFSPLAVDWAPARAASRARVARDETPFYEKVNRFVFGPPPPQEEPRAMERKILAELRAQRGRIGLADVMRVTGLPRDRADPLMARLMLDYDGDVEVSEEGGIFYRFEAMRRTAGEADPRPARPAPVWARPLAVPPLTGNRPESNLLVAALNAFNLLMGLFAIAGNLTIARVAHLLERVPPGMMRAPMPYDGVPIALGVIPVAFSLLLFVLPIGRALAARRRARAVAKENARLAVLREVLTRVDAKTPVTDDALARAWTQAAGSAPASKELTRVVVELGGDAQIEESTGEVRYRFVDLETEAAALEAERAAAPDEEARVGRVVFASDR